MKPTAWYFSTPVVLLKIPCWNDPLSRLTLEKQAYVKNGRIEIEKSMLLPEA